MHNLNSGPNLKFKQNFNQVSLDTVHQDLIFLSLEVAPRGGSRTIYHGSKVFIRPNI